MVTTGVSTQKGNIMFSKLSGIFLVLVTGNAFPSNESPYAGQENRQIKALSQEEVEGYLTGKGLGYAKAAELNHYPGPRHVLDMADKLELSEDQAKKSQAIFDKMKLQAQTYGTQLVDKERELDTSFSNASIQNQKLERLLSEIGALQSKIRYIHLAAHLEEKALLTEHQIHRYEQLRGYVDGTSTTHHHEH